MEKHDYPTTPDKSVRGHLWAKRKKNRPNQKGPSDTNNQIDNYKWACPPLSHHGEGMANDCHFYKY